MLLGGRYELHGRVGEGGMALVYRATDQRLGRDVAVKMLRPQYAGDPDFVARFQREAQAAGRLSHPNIAAVFDTGQDGDHHYIVMELLRGVTLRDLIQQSPGGRLPAADMVRIATEIAAALAAAHQSGVVHRDIKPHNVLFTDDGHVKVTDFGIAKALAATGGTATGTIMGSPHYISPEQASGEPAGPASDIYSLGIVCYEMLTGQPPYSGETPVAIAVQHLRGTPRPIRDSAPELNPAVEMVIFRALARRPEDRFATAREFAEALQAALSGRLPAGDQTTVMPRTTVAQPHREREPAVAPAGAIDRTPPRRLSPLATAVVTVLIMLCLGGGVMIALMHPRGGKPAPDNPVNPAPAQSLVVEDLVGQDVDSARQRLEQQYQAQGILPPQVVEIKREDNAVPRNQILRQDPGPGAMMRPGGVIKVVVSSGVEPVTMPDVVGQSLEEARALLNQQSLQVGKVKRANSDTIAAETVMAQSVPPGMARPAGSSVDLTVSKGPAEQTPPDNGEPKPVQPSISIGEPTDAEGGKRAANVVVSMPESGKEISVSLRWLKGEEGEAGGGTVKPGGMFNQEVRGQPGSVLGVFVDGEKQQEVQF
ncbi:MAG: Stk1 family PASTA domain-containing Ser/Thr kinase [Armatimonadetes bacterium]|nr:Stk1 family PASTA domain-containing Ser/Thr kinase [Armatimonadota bacterium]